MDENIENTFKATTEALKTLNSKVASVAADLAEVKASGHQKGDTGERGPIGPVGPVGAAGAPGRDADPVEVADVLIKMHAELVRGPKGDRGERGEKGVDGKDATPAAVAAELLKHADILRGPQGPAGADGKDGEKGADGKSVSAPEVAAELLKHADFLRGENGRDGIDGIDGKDADPFEVARELAVGFRDILRGEKGADGQTTVVYDHEIKSWAPGIHRAGSVVTHFIGQKFVALCDTSDEPGDSADWERKGQDGMRFREDHKGSREGDLFIRDFTLWGVIGGKERLLVARPKVDVKGIAASVAADAELREVVMAAAKDIASEIAADVADKMVATEVTKAVQVQQDDNEDFLIVGNKAIHLPKIPEDVQKFITGFYDTKADGPLQVGKFHGMFLPGMDVARGDLVSIGHQLWQAVDNYSNVSAVVQGPFICVVDASAGGMIDNGSTGGGGGGTGSDLPTFPSSNGPGQVLAVGPSGSKAVWSTALKDAIADVLVAKTDAAAAKAAADAVSGTANTALSAANTAKTAAATAQTAADAASALATTAKTTADTAKATADHALAVANAAGGGSGGGSGTGGVALPAYPSTDGAGQVLAVAADGASLEWSTGLKTAVASMQAKITMGEENTLPAARTVLHTASGAPAFALTNSVGEIALELKADGSAGVVAKLGTTSHSLALFMANGDYSLAGGRIHVNSGGTVTLQVAPAGTASGLEVATAGFVKARIATVDTEVAAVKATADSAVQNVKGVTGIWFGTQAEFDAITTKVDTVIYHVKA